jgi:elongation factor G
VLSGMGALHLEITTERLKRRSGLSCKLGAPQIPYRETITKKVTRVEGKQKKQTGGHGQFGVCYIDVEPLPRGKGFQFEDAIVGGVIPRQLIPSVEKGVVRAMTKGALCGYPVVDVKVKLIDGKTHSVDSSDHAFQVAGFRGFRAAMTQATPVLLEPIMKMEVTVPEAMMGDVIGDLNSRHARVLGTDSNAGRAVITAYIPLAQTLDYEPRLSNMTHGRGTYAMVFDHYDPVPPQVQDKLVKERGGKTLEDDEG